MKTLKQFIFERMDKNNYVLDQEVSNFLGKEPNFSATAIYQQEWQTLNNQKLNFEDFIKEKGVYISKYKNSNKYSKTRYTLSKKSMGNQGWKITKSYFEYLKEKGIKEMSL